LPPEFCRNVPQAGSDVQYTCTVTHQTRSQQLTNQNLVAALIQLYVTFFVLMNTLIALGIERKEVPANRVLTLGNAGKCCGEGI
ncbi:MAG: hypothetical protein KGL39_57360, partial [Patescibacteria group bacterium]|nr:hypothetical protein [Patescibacteria group bacterium]